METAHLRKRQKMLWTPAHMGLTENEAADESTLGYILREVLDKPLQLSMPNSYREMITYF